MAPLLLIWFGTGITRGHQPPRHRVLPGSGQLGNWGCWRPAAPHRHAAFPSGYRLRSPAAHAAHLAVRPIFAGLMVAVVLSVTGAHRGGVRGHPRRAGLMSCRPRLHIGRGDQFSGAVVLGASSGCAASGCHRVLSSGSCSCPRTIAAPGPLRAHVRLTGPQTGAPFLDLLPTSLGPMPARSRNVVAIDLHRSVRSWPTRARLRDSSIWSTRPLALPNVYSHIFNPPRHACSRPLSVGPTRRGDYHARGWTSGPPGNPPRSALDDWAYQASRLCLLRALSSRTLSPRLRVTSLGLSVTSRVVCPSTFFSAIRKHCALSQLESRVGAR